MKPKAPIVRELDAHTYRGIAGELRKKLPGKVIIDVERATKDGKKIARLRCRFPALAKRLIAQALGEAVAIAERSAGLSRPFTPRRKRDHWERSMDMHRGGTCRDPIELRQSMDMKSREMQEQADGYATRFRDDINRYKERMQVDKGVLGQNESYRQQFHAGVEEVKERLHGPRGTLQSKSLVNDGARSDFQKGVDKYRNRMRGKGKMGYPGVAEAVVKGKRKR